MSEKTMIFNPFTGAFEECAPNRNQEPKTIKEYIDRNFKKDVTYFLDGGKLCWMSRIGKQELDLRCAKQSKNYRLYVYKHYDQGDDTTYYIADRNTGNVFKYEAHAGLTIFDELRTLMNADV